MGKMDEEIPKKDARVAGKKQKSKPFLRAAIDSAVYTNQSPGPHAESEAANQGAANLGAANQGASNLGAANLGAVNQTAVTNIVSTSTKQVTLPTENQPSSGGNTSDASGETNVEDLSGSSSAQNS